MKCLLFQKEEKISNTNQTVQISSCEEGVQKGQKILKEKGNVGKTSCQKKVK